MTRPTDIVQITPAGRGAVATCLVSGLEAGNLVAPLISLRAGSLASLPLGRIAFGLWQGTQREEVVVVRRSSEEVAIHCHGGLVPIATIMADLATAGGRIVEWPNWLANSSGWHDTPLDPIRADAVVALSQARTERCAVILLDQFQGALSNELHDLTELLRGGGESTAVCARLAALLAHAQLGLHLDTPWQVVICGAPNVGKSSLINALLGYGRAIVTPEPGTTRDVVSAATAVEGWPVELVDTAGIRAKADELEAAGIAAGRQRLATADLRLLVFDRSAPFGPAEAALAADWPGAMIVHNKCDLPPHYDPRPQGIELSALTGHGIDTLLRELAEQLVPHAPPPLSPVPFRTRHASAISTACDLLKQNETQQAIVTLQSLLTPDH